MRTPKYLSHSSLSLWGKDREEFYLRHLAEKRAPSLPQERVMSIGSSFDAYTKAAMHAVLFGEGSDPRYTFEALFEKQVEPHNRDWAREHGKYVFECYQYSGFYDELLTLLKEADEPPQFEFEASAIIGGVPMMGKPDCRFVRHKVHVIHDWKVLGYCSIHSPSPAKNYRICRDAYDYRLTCENATKACPEGKPSSSHDKAHGGYLPYDHHGLEINVSYMEDAKSEYADQLSVYGWMLGEQVGDENVVLSIDETVCKFKGDGVKPLLRVANHRARVRAAYQHALLKRAQDCWNAITSGHIFQDMTREESDSRCEVLERSAVSLQSDGTKEGDWFNEVTRPQFRW